MKPKSSPALSLISTIRHFFTSSRRSDTGSALTAGQLTVTAPWLYLLLFVVAFIPRVWWLDVYVAPDEGKWIYRSAHFLQALLSGDWGQMTSVAATPEVEVLAPAVTTMWSGAVGLAAKWGAAGTTSSLLDELATIPTDTEKIPLSFYPWTRFPTVLLTSLFVPLFYFLLAKLIRRPVAFVAALLLALDPFFIGLSRVIHHDALVAIFITLSLLLLLIHQQTTPTRRWSRWLVGSGVTAGLALLTKPTALYLVIFTGLFLLAAVIWPQDGRGETGDRGRDGGRRRTKDEGEASQRGSVWLTDYRLSPIYAGVVWLFIAGVTVVLLWPAMWVAPVGTIAGLVERAGAVSDNNYAFFPRPGEPLPDLGFLFYPLNWLFKTTLPVMLGLMALLIFRERGQVTETIPDERDAQRRLPVTRWLGLFALLFLLLLIPVDTRDVRYFLPAVPALYALAAIGLFGWLAGRQRFGLYLGLIVAAQLLLALFYAPYFVSYWNPTVGGPWLAPRLVKIGSGEALDQVGRYLSRKPQAETLTVATSFWESFVPFFPGDYTKAHYDEEADYILIYRRQIQNNNPFAEYWPYFEARTPEHQVALAGVTYAWLYPGPQLRVVREAEFGEGLMLRGYRLTEPAAQPGRPAELHLVWSETAAGQAQEIVRLRLTGPDGQTWLEVRGPLLSPDGPSAVEGRYPLEIPASMPRGDYALWVAVGADTEPLKVGSIPVRHLDPPPLPIDLAANFEGMIALEGAAVDPTRLSPGQPLDLTYLWQARQPLFKEYTTFTHIVDEAGNVWGQVDRVPGDGAWPTSTWQPEEWIVDSFQIRLKPETPPGRYDVLVGLYDSQSLERLSISDPEAEQTVFYLTSITVQ